MPKLDFFKAKSDNFDLLLELKVLPFAVAGFLAIGVALVLIYLAIGVDHMLKFLSRLNRRLEPVVFTYFWLETVVKWIFTRKLPDMGD